MAATKSKPKRTVVGKTDKGTLGILRKDGEGSVTFLLRIVREWGSHPLDLLESPNFCADAGIDPAAFDPEDRKALVRDSWDLYVEWAKGNNQRYLKGEKGVGWTDTDARRRAVWFGSGAPTNKDLAEKKRYLEALDRQKLARAEGSPAEPSKTPSPARSAASGTSPQAVGRKPLKRGVIAEIIACLRGASAKRPTTVDEILAHLVKEFPDRQPQAMRSTITSQIPSGLRVEKKLIVQGDKATGWWLPKE